MTKHQVYEHHPYCDLFPDITDAELQVLADDIEANGMHQPIVRWKKLILDGKNRLAACERAGRKPDFVDWFPTHPEDGEASEKEALAFVLGANLHRRQLTESQRAMVAARLANMSVGRPETIVARDTISQTEAAEDLDVSRGSVNRASSILKTGATSLIDAVDHGEVTVNDAAKIVDLPKTEQAEAVKAVRNGTAKTVTQAAKADKPPKNGRPDREPGDESESEPQAFKIQRSKTIKTVEALMRAFDDLHGMHSNRMEHANAIASCKVLLKTAKDWT